MLSDFLIEKSWGCGNWGGAELAEGAGKERIYVVEPTGDFEDDPNVTDKKFPGNLTKSYRSKHPLKIVAEVINWEGHSPEILNNMLELYRFLLLFL